MSRQSFDTGGFFIYRFYFIPLKQNNTHSIPMALNVQVGADVTAFQAGMQQVAAGAQSASNSVSRSLSDAAMQTDRLGGAAQSASMRMMQMRSGISAARDGVLAFTVGGQAAERSLLAMGHHINSLVNETGSFKGAMTALASSLWGPGGVILGVSVAVELFMKWKDRQKEAAASQTEFQKALETSVKTSADELSHLTILYQASQNDALSRQQRLIAVRELQKEYPAYFGNMSKEAILAGEAAGAYDRLSNSIINSAAAKAGQESLAEQIKPLIQIQAQLQTNEREADEQWQRIKRINAEKAAAAEKQKQQGFTPANTNIATPGFRPIGATQQTRIVANNSAFITDTDGDVKSLDDYKKAIQDKIKDNAAAIQGVLEQYGVQTLLKGEGIKPEKIKTTKDGLALLQEELKNAETALENSIFAGKTNAEDVDSPLARRVAAATEAIRKFKSDIDAVLGGIGANNTTVEDSIKSVKPTANTNFGGGNDAVISGMQAQVKAFNDIRVARQAASAGTKQYNQDLKNEALAGKEIARVFGNGLMSAFQSALSGTQSFVSAMGQFLLQLIEKLIAAAAAAAILAALLSITGFAEVGSFTSIFGSLSGLSGLMGSSSGGASALPTHAAGGIFTKAHAGVFGEAGPEAIVTPKHLQDFAGMSGSNNNQKIQIEPFQIGAEMWFRQTTRTNKRIGRTS